MLVLPDPFKVQKIVVSVEKFSTFVLRAPVISDRQLLRPLVYCVIFEYSNGIVRKGKTDAHSN